MGVKLVLAAIAAALAGAPPGHAVVAGGSAGSPCGWGTERSGTYSHVVAVVLENKSYGEVIGSRNAPYVNSLASRCGLATDYHAVTHPSLPNYLALVSGRTAGLDGLDCSPGPACESTARTIFGQLAGDWSTFAESMPSACDRHDAGAYLVRHNPAVYFPRLAGCRTRDLPYGRFQLSRRFTLVVPNACNDMHDCSVATGDRWLAGFVPRITGSRAFAAGRTALFVMWDEDDGSAGNRVPMIVVSPYTAPGTRSSTRFTHYSALRTWERMLSLPCLANACSAPGMRAAFGL
ncbi:MAG: hypothetical protein E6G67_07235 [Actinobacteria bacterium]|nr:MAG: hypothetical protein E6G67_07235 [Actinomycetota bacterium]